jgi:hypothetical protein
VKGKLQNKSPGQGKALAWALVALYLLMLALNVLTPMSGDDFAHYYGVDGEHIRSLAQIGENLRQLRQNVNGRVLAHFFVYLMQIPPRGLFRILNAAVLPGLLWLLLRFLRPAERGRARWLLLGGMLLWCWMPGFGEVFLWLTGSCNYGWSLPLLFAALLPFYRAAVGAGETQGPGKTGLWCLLCLLAGAYNENCAIALLAAAGLLGLTAWIGDRRFPGRAALAWLCGLGGFALLLFAPATLATRTGGLSPRELALGFKNVLGVLETGMLPLFLLYALLFAWSLEKKTDRRVLAASGALLLGGLVSALALSAGAYLALRCFAPTGCLAALACLVLAAALPERERKGRVAAVLALVSVLFAFAFLRGTGDVFSLFLQGREREAAVRAARESGQQELTLKPYVTATGWAEISYEELEEEPGFWYNELLARHYGLEQVRGELPDREAGVDG